MKLDRLIGWLFVVPAFGTADLAIKKRHLLPLALANALSVGACSKEPVATPTGAQPADRTSVDNAAASGVSPGLPAKLCDVLRKVTPEARQMPPVGAQAQLVMAIAAAFDNNAAALDQVADNIDAIAGGSCAAERDILLSVLKKTSLQAAVR